MYRLKQADIIESQELSKHLKPYGYVPVRYTPGLQKHTQEDTLFTMVADDFAIKYTTKENADHLMNALKDKYAILVDWEASLYIGMILEWDYHKRTVTLSIPEYVKKALHKLKQ